jgi:hypothetical protein
MSDNTRITLAVNYPVIDLNLCNFFGSHEGTVDSRYNLIATVNRKPSKKNDGHYTGVNRGPTSRSWYKYDDNIVNLVKFVKRNTNSVLMDFQKIASILFYLDVKYVSVCHNNLCNDHEVTAIMGHNIPPVIDQLQDATSSLSSRNTSSLLSSYVLSPLSSNNSSRSLTSVRLKSNLDNNSLFLSSSQSTNNGKGNSSDIRIAKYFLSFCNWAMGLMSEGIYNTPHQELCVARKLGRNMSKMVPCAHKGCTMRVHRFCQIDWLHQHDLEVNHKDPVFANSTTCVTKIMFNRTLRFPSGSSPTTSYSNSGAQGEWMYAWVFWYDKKSFKTIDNVLACYSYHNPNTLVCSETQAMV